MALPLFSSLTLLLAVRIGQSAAHDVSQHGGCVHMPIIHSTNTQYFEKRAISLALANRSDIAYYAQRTAESPWMSVPIEAANKCLVNIGNPVQSVFVQLDTGSFELWVNPDCSSLQGSDIRFCRSAGRYDTSRSSTGRSLGTGRLLRYGIDSANITYFTDDMNLPGSPAILRSVQFGVAIGSEDMFSGIMGIGYGQGIATRYRNFIDELRAQNVTKVKAFTIALGSRDEQEGVLVFGGVDTSRFSGNLARIPIIPTAISPDQVPRYWVTMQSITLNPPRGRPYTYPNSSLPVFLDTGATMTLLPTELASEIARDFGSTGNDAGGFYQISCDFLSVDGSLDFAFAGTTINVPYMELIREVEGSPPACFLGISPSSDFTLLGDTFLRSAYTTFDLDNNVVWMAQAANCGSTPAALMNMSAMSTLIGACGVSNAATVGSPGGTSGTSGAVASGTTASSSSQSGSTSIGRPSTASSIGSSSATARQGLVWAAPMGLLLTLRFFVDAPSLDLRTTRIL